MKKRVMSLNLLEELNTLQTYSAIENDIIVFEAQHINFLLNQPFKVDTVLILVCLSGTLSGAINLKTYNAQAPFLVFVLPGQVLQQDIPDEDFKGLFLILSQRFSDTLLSQIQDKFPMFLSSINRPVTQLDAEQLLVVKTCYKAIHRVIAETQNPYRLEIVKYLMMSVFYGLGSWLHELPEQGRSKQEILVKNFLNLVREHCIEERGLNFYADKLCITPKHLSKVIKGNSNMSAAAWIDNSVVLEARVMLKSTNMTIQQISDELNFTSQSFFGKFFKRVTGMSPKEYRKLSS